MKLWIEFLVNFDWFARELFNSQAIAPPRFCWKILLKMFAMVSQNFPLTCQNFKVFCEVCEQQWVRSHLYDRAITISWKIIRLQVFYSDKVHIFRLLCTLHFYMHLASIASSNWISQITLQKLSIYLHVEYFDDVDPTVCSMD